MSEGEPTFQRLTHLEHQVKNLEEQLEKVLACLGEWSQVQSKHFELHLHIEQERTRKSIRKARRRALSDS